LYPFFSKEIFRIFVGGVYSQGMIIVPVIAFSYLLYGIADIFNAGLYIKSKTEYLALITLFPFILNILLDIIFIPEYGIIAAAYSTLISYLLLAILSFFFTERIMHSNYKFVEAIIITISVIMLYLIGIHYNIFIKLIISAITGGYLIYAYKKA